MSRTYTHKPYKVLTKEHPAEIHDHSHGDCTIDQENGPCHYELDNYAVTKNGSLCGCDMCNPPAAHSSGRHAAKQVLRQTQYEVNAEDPYEDETLFEKVEELPKKDERKFWAPYYSAPPESVDNVTETEEQEGEGNEVSSVDSPTVTGRDSQDYGANVSELYESEAASNDDKENKASNQHENLLS